MSDFGFNISVLVRYLKARVCAIPSLGKGRKGFLHHANYLAFGASLVLWGCEQRQTCDFKT